MGPDIYALFKNFSTSYAGLFELLMNFSIVAGVAVTLWGLNAARPNSHYQANSGGSAVGALWSVGIGAALIFVPGMIDAATATFFNTSTSEFSYIADTAASSDPFGPIKGFIRLFGVFAFIRGLFALRTLAVHGQRGGMSLSKASVWLVSGTLLVNLDMTLRVMANTFGVTAFGVWAGG